MLVIGLVLGVLLSVLLCTVAFVLGGMSFGSKKEKEESDVVVIDKEDVEELLADYAGEGHMMDVSKNVELQMSNFAFDWVKAYGKKYSSVDAALESCDELTDYERKELADMEAEIKIIRGESIAPRRFRSEITRHGETVVVYEPCLMKIDVPSREGKPARIAVKIVREGLETYISEIYTSDTDVTNPNERYTWKMDNPDRVETFELLIGNDPEFADEYTELAHIEAEIDEYNEYALVKKRIAFNKTGDIVLLPPSLEELKARMNIKEEPEVEVEVVEAEIVVEEFVSSSAK